MASNRRAKGSVEKLPSGALRVRVYAGIDPVTGRRHYLTEQVPAGRNAEREAEAVRARLVAEVAERRNPRTRDRLGAVGALPSAVRAVHCVLSGAFRWAVRWRWAAVDSIAEGKPPAAKPPNPRPPTPAQAARILTEAWD